MDSTLSPERRAALAIAAAAIIVVSTAFILPATSFTVSTVGTQDKLDQSSQRPTQEAVNYTDLSASQQQIVDEAIENESVTIGTGDPPFDGRFAVTKDGTTYVMQTKTSVEGQFILFSAAIVLGAFAVFMWATGADRDIGSEKVSPAPQDEPWDYDIEDSDSEEQNGGRSR